MAGRRAIAPPLVAVTSLTTVEDPATQRALDQVQTGLQRLQATRSRVVLTADLAIGTNVIRHGLGRAVVGYTLTPTVADAGFAHAIDLANTNPELEVWITVVGAAQPGARIEAW